MKKKLLFKFILKIEKWMRRLIGVRIHQQNHIDQNAKCCEEIKNMKNSSVLMWVQRVRERKNGDEREKMGNLDLLYP